jgi:hypothetical protein
MYMIYNITCNIGELDCQNNRAIGTPGHAGRRMTLHSEHTDSNALQ